MTDKSDKKETLQIKKPAAKLQLSKSVDKSSRGASSGSSTSGGGRSKTVTVQVKKTRGGTSSAKETRKETATTSVSSGSSGELSDKEQKARLAAIEKANKEGARSSAKTDSSNLGKVVIPAASKKKRAKDNEPTAKKEDKPANVAAAQPEPSKPAKPAGGGKKASPQKLSLKADKERGDASQFLKARKEEPRRRRDRKLTVLQAMNQDDRMRSMASIKRQREKAKRKEGHADTGPVEKQMREVTIPEVITVQELANRMAERAVDVIKALMRLDIMATVNQTIDADTAELVVEEFGHTVKRVTEGDVENIFEENEDKDEDMKPRPPVVTVMGHVDHGKTSLLDALRSTNVTEGEAGGITQHIGAYQVDVKNHGLVTFLDTPGHAAFSAMRARGAQATDIVVLVVAANDGVMPQTIEAINHAKAAGVPLIVAINKMDLPEANPDRVINELLGQEVVTEKMGGDVQAIEISAKTGKNLDKLLESIVLQAEILELTANPNRKATGVVVEAELDKGRGVVATLLVQKGTLKQGDIVVCGEGFGKTRALIDDKGKNVEEAEPSKPVEVLGLNALPGAGDVFNVVDSEKQAREITSYREKRDRDLRATEAAKVSLDSLFQQAGEDGVKELNLIIKGDVQGSVEAIEGSLTKLPSDEVKVKVVHGAAGAINESDINLAKATGAMVIGFNVRANVAAKQLADQENIDIRYYSIIYNLIDDIKDSLSTMLKPAIREEFIGNAEIREIFNMSKYGKVAGCYVKDGFVKRGAGVRLLRDNVVIHEGKLKTLRRFKDDVQEVKEGNECGMAFENYEDIREGDVIEAFELVEEKRTI